MKTQQIWKCGFLVVMVLGSILTACTKYDTPMEVEEEGKTASRASIEKYVLWINLDGAGGGDLAKNAFPENGCFLTVVIRGMGWKRSMWKERTIHLQRKMQLHLLQC